MAERGSDGASWAFLPETARQATRRSLEGSERQYGFDRDGLRWRDAPSAYGPPKTLYDRWKRWSEKRTSARKLLELTDQSGELDALMIEAKHPKTHRKAISLGVERHASWMGWMLPPAAAAQCARLAL